MVAPLWMRCVIVEINVQGTMDEQMWKGEEDESEMGSEWGDEDEDDDDSEDEDGGSEDDRGATVS